MVVEKVSYSYHLEADAGTSGFKDIHTVEPGRKFHAKRIEVSFPTGTEDDLEIALYYGNRKICPKAGVFRGDNVKYEKEIDVTYYSSDPVKVYYRNLNTTYKRICDIVVEGILE